MRLKSQRIGYVALAVSLAVARPVLAQSSSPDGGVVEPPGPSTTELVPPILKSHPEAPYPPEARAAGREGNVGLELTVDETGAVVEARVTAGAGNGFDEAAVLAARRFTFEPARRGGAPIRATVQFTYEFRLPPATPAAPTAAPPQPAPAPPTPPSEAAPIAQSGADQSTLVLATRPISAASSFQVRDRDFQLRPIGSVQDILRVTPGLVMVQHSGGGKANQYFLRGFDADHGTDIALSIDGIPINMVSHGHGQGFADTNFIIPEVVERVEVTKGPYFAHQGDFATAGAVNMVSRDDFEHSSLGFGVGGSPGHGGPSYRGLLVASPKMENVKATFAAEVGRSDGPFDHPDGWDKYKLWNKLTFALTPTSSLSIGESSYASSWHGSGQIAARAVEQGIVSRFGSIDPDEGGATARHQLFVQYKLRPTETSELKALAYLGTYRFNLYSNFTLSLRDPVDGDEIGQLDRRSFYGGRASYRIMHEAHGVRFDTTIGGDGRNDDIHGELTNTLHRSVTSTVRSTNVHESFVGAFVNEEMSPARWLRFDVGGRADFLSYSVDELTGAGDPTGPATGADGAHQFSPKTSLIVSPLAGDDASLDVYANYGHGFHSNDVRGAFSTPAVSPLTRAIGEEVGARTRLFRKWDLAAAVFMLDLEHETVWSGDEGTTEVSDATKRRGVEVETRYEIFPWLAADLDLTFTDSRFRENAGNGNGLALAPKQTWAGGLSARHGLGPGVARGGLRFYGVGDRPATDDGALTAPGFTQIDLHLGYRHRRFDVAFDVENLLNGAFRSAQFATTGRMPNEPAVGAAVPAGFGCGSSGRLAPAPDGGAANGRFYGCEDVHYTPAYPLTARFMGTVFLD